MSTSTELEYLFHHMFLPPDLPQADDNGAKNDAILARIMLQCAEEFAASAQSHGYALPESWDSAQMMLESSVALSASHPLSEDVLCEALSKLRVGDVFCQLIRAQNAGIVVRLIREEAIFEVFEVTPPNTDIMKCEGKLLSSFPTHAIPIPLPVFSNPHFQENLAKYLCHMNIDELEESAARTKKAGSTVIEIRDSPDPKFITNLLVTILAGTSETSSIQDPLLRISKRIADDVLWKNALAPWRRSKLWLVIRVALQTTLEARQYKELMVFALTIVLERALDLDMSNDTIQCMVVKCSKRIVKLSHGHGCPAFVEQRVSAACVKADTLLKRRWDATLSRIEPGLSGWDPARLSIQDDTSLRLRDSSPILAGILTGLKSVAPSPSFYQPEHPYRLRRNSYDYVLQNLTLHSGQEKYISLIDFENATREGLHLWTQENLQNPSAGQTLLRALRSYFSTASAVYGSNAENQSLMILTVIELWRSIDQISLAQCSMIGDYPPEVSPSLLENLLLCHKEDLDRVQDLAIYLNERKGKVLYRRSIFEATSTPESFGPRYYEASPKLKNALSVIESQAHRDRSEKIAELKTLNAEYRYLKLRVATLGHDHREYIVGKGRKRRIQIDTSCCEPCRLDKQAENMEISVYEWPLPRDHTAARVTVFELHCPPVYSTWREATYTVLHDLLSPKSNHPTPQTFVTLSSYMNGIGVRHIGIGRITLASSTKSFLISHYRKRKIPVSDESEVCVNNGLTWQLCNVSAERWVTPDDLVHVEIPSRCCMTLPNEILYKGLEFSVSSSSHSTNTVVAAQGLCSRDLSLHEFLSFGALRAGGRLQWMNIVRELSSNDLGCSHDTVYLLIATAVQEVGVLSAAGESEWHIDLTLEGFGNILLDGIRQLHISVAENWQEVATLKALILMLIRLLSSTRSNKVAVDACKTLREIRETLYGWLKQLLSSFSIQDDLNVDYIKSRVRDVAATCRMTYDVGRVHLDHILAEARDLEILMHCGVALHDNRSSTLPTDSASRTVLDRGVRSMVRVEEDVWNMTKTDSQGMDDAINAIWSTFHRGTSWSRMAAPNERWVHCKTHSDDKTRPQNVQMNLLDGQLLIDGKPLGALPVDITNHAVYQRLFGKRMLLVIPANLTGMDFQSRATIEENQVYLSLRQGNLIVKTRSTSGTIRQYIPHRHFQKDLPTPLVNNFAHWLNLSSQVVEFRPLRSPWTMANVKYRLHFSLSESSRLYDQRKRTLVDPYSATFQMIYSRLSCLESRDFVTMFYRPDSPGGEGPSVHPLSAHLPRFKLDFLLDMTQRELECANISGMVIDSNQSIGTLHGLRSKLVLRDQTKSHSRPQSRSVLIPLGDVSHSRDKQHISVRIDTGSSERVAYNLYILDTLVGRLIDDGTLGSRLYKIYLLALTSHWLPDTLTGRTGTEEALSELNSARCMSFMRLQAADARMLELLKALSPRREFYPSHLKVMQTVHWSTLPVSSQSYEFEEAVLRILRVDQQLTVFDNTAVSFSTPVIHDNIYSRSPPSLVRRARARELSSRPLILTVTRQDHQVSDVAYISRVRLQSTNTHSYAAARAAFQENPGALGYQYKSSESLKTQLLSLGTVSRDGPLPPQLSYSRYWLKSPDLASSWIMLYNCSRSTTLTTEEKKYQLLFSLPAHVFSMTTSNAIRLVAQILAFSLDPVFQSHSPPAWSHYDLSNYGDAPTANVVSERVKSCKKALAETTSSFLLQLSDEEDEDWEDRCEEQYMTVVSAQTSAFTAQLMAQWPSLSPTKPSTGNFDHLSTSAALTKARVVFENCFRNREFSQFAAIVQTKLNRIAVQTSVKSLDCRACYPNPSGRRPYLSTVPDFLDMNHRPAPDMDLLLIEATRDIPTVSRHHQETSGLYSPDSAQHLRSVVSVFLDDPTKVLAHAYGKDMEESLNTLLNAPSGLRSSSTSDLPGLSLQDYLKHCQAQFQVALHLVHSTLQPQTQVLAEIMAKRAGLSFPRQSVRSILFMMTWTFWPRLPNEWKTALVIFATSVVRLQQAHRLLRLDRQQKLKDIQKELENLVSLDGDLQRYLEHPDWLLIQIESDVHLRKLQMDVALEMYRPSLEANSALQLNMGEGKSSVITPMVAASLSDSTKLVRVIALKSLVPQMFQLLLTRLGDLCNRRIFFLPFSRQMKSSDMGKIHSLYQECMTTQGVLIAQPEHILSAKLLSVEQMVISTASPKFSEGPLQALEVQRFLETHSRDILDESDELLHVRYQLIYTMGQQHAMDGHPDRWSLIQNTLLLAMEYADVMKQESNKITVTRAHASSFPLIHFEVGDEVEILKAYLLEQITEDITSKSLPSLSVSYLGPETRILLKKYLTHKDISEEDRIRLESAIGSTTAWKAVLVLRGILAYDILLYCLCERRWRVDYGLDRGRSLLAVPYRAKDVPSLRAEFGHPDVAIVLTCLAYYYHGLTSDEVSTVFQRLLKTSNPEQEYGSWIQCIPADDLPASLKTAKGINTQDRVQHSKTLVPLFRLNRATINFYLCDVVFPKGAKEFPQKLPTSGWDLAETKAHVTTGFSGTNDNRFLLPSSITQVDPVKQNATNALVLSHLLNQENAHYLCARNDKGHALSGKEFVDVLAGNRKPMIRVLLDVGAQVLDMSNQALVEYWLTLEKREEAGIFFNDADELTVVTRDGNVESFLTSPYRYQTGKCLVYLDDAHTRGTDLKLPPNARAAVTLGRKVTKDRLVQGCMRMRQLGHGQSVMFFAPPETDAAIRKTCHLSPDDSIQVANILQWSMGETLADIRHHLPYWAAQGADYQARRLAMDRLPKTPAKKHIGSLKEAWLQQEARTLSEMYDLQPNRNILSPTLLPLEISSRLDGLDVSGTLEHAVDEEQEREVSHEMEIERQIERPRPVVACSPSLHTDVVNFVKTGVLRRLSSAFSPLSHILESVPYWSSHNQKSVFHPGLVATRDFALTIERRNAFDENTQEYLNPVRWLLTAKNRQVIVIISQFEANSLLPSIRSSSRVRLHVYAPRTTKNMPVFDDLQFYCVPPLPPNETTSLALLKPLITQLNIFAGQLYPTSYSDYLALCDFLGIDAHGVQQADSDGFVKPQNRTVEGTIGSPFVTSPVPFLKALMNLRRKHQDFERTPIGKLLAGRARGVVESDL